MKHIVKTPGKVEREYRWVYNRIYKEFNLYEVSEADSLGGWKHLATTYLAGTNENGTYVWKIIIGLGPEKETFDEEYSSETEAFRRLIQLLGLDDYIDIAVDKKSMRA